MIAEFSIVPLGKGESLSGLVAKVADIVDKSGLPYKFTSMGTIVEGEWDDVLALIKDCHLTLKRQASRLMTTINIDDRDKASGRIKGKVEAVEAILGRHLKT